MRRAWRARPAPRGHVPAMPFSPVLLAPIPGSRPSAPSSPTRSRRPFFPRRGSAFRNAARGRHRRTGRAHRRRGRATSRASSPCRTTRRSRWRCAITATSSASTTPTSATGAASCSRSCARPGQRPAARSRHQGLRPHALVARRRRAADPEGRRARGAGHRDAGGAGRAHLARPSRLIETGEALQRNDEPSPTRAAVLTRLSHSHIRFGTFQRHAALERPDLIADADRPRGRGLLSRAGGTPTTRPRRCWPPWSAKTRRARRALDGRRLRPRRAQHRQHEHQRRELRLRPLPLPAAQRSQLRRRLFRSRRPLQLRPPARGGVLEPAPAGRRPQPRRARPTRWSRR